MAKRNYLFPVDGATAFNAPLLTAEEETTLILKAQRGDTFAKQTLINRNARLVIKEAKNFLGRGLEEEDLVQEGFLGMAHAIEKFDVSLGHRLSTYAVNWIRQAMGVAILKTGRTIRLPASQVAKVGEIVKARNEFIQEYHVEPTPEELSEALEFAYAPDDISATLLSACSTVSADEPLGDDEDAASRSDFMTYEDDSVAESTAKAEQIAMLGELVGCLNDREKFIIKSIYGFDTEEKSLSELASVLNISRERVRQIQQGALARMRRAAGSRLTR